jgi:hypothetical protein
VNLTHVPGISFDGHLNSELVVVFELEPGGLSLWDGLCSKSSG